jgi:O-antigen chain-terminating methyltransferase
VEHLPADYLMQMLATAYHKLRPGSKIVLETINPACWTAFFDSYLRDLTHVQPVHPDTLKYLLRTSGFQHVEIRYRAAYPDADKLQSVSAPEHAEPLLHAFIDVHNANVRRLNDLMFSYLDYAAVGVRP